MIPLIIIAGPTAIGKSDVAFELAKRLNTEIISADSMQVYRYFNIGTAKPSPERQKEIQHHLIDIVNPDAKVIDSLSDLNLPAGVDIEIKM